MFITCGTRDLPIYEIWLNKKELGFQFSRQYQGIPGSGQVSFSDVDADGTIDIVVPVCFATCRINVIYNQQTPLCRPGLERKCRESLCIGDTEFIFDFDSLTMPNLQIGVNVETGEPLVVTSDSLLGSFPVPIRIGKLQNDFRGFQ